MNIFSLFQIVDWRNKIPLTPFTKGGKEKIPPLEKGGRGDFSKKLILGLLVFTLQAFVSNDLSDKSADSASTEIFKQIENKNIYKSSAGSAVAEIARYFIGTPYVGGTLEGEPESCRYDFTGLDCVTLVENSLALYRTAMAGDKTITGFTKELTYIRYRGGVLNGYASRLHYTSDWIYDNCEKKVFEDVTKELGGKKLRLAVYFMSANPNYYPALKNNPELTSEIAAIEEKINKRTLYYIPLNKIKEIAPKLQSGDIICMATDKEALDYSHLGIAFVENGKTGLIHASSKQKKVVHEKDLFEYVSSVKSNIGITVLRPIKPKVHGK